MTDFGHPIRATDVYRGEAIEFMLRGLLDTVASMVKRRGHSQQTWLHTWGLPTVEHWIGPGGRLASRSLYDRQHAGPKDSRPRGPLPGTRWAAEAPSMPTAADPHRR